MDKNYEIYKQAYDKASEELSGLIREHERIEKRIVSLRQNIRSLATLCEDNGIQVTPNPDVQEIRQSSSLADDVRAILKKYSPDYIRPTTIKHELEELGWDLTEHKNPLATIYSVINRMIEARGVEEDKDAKGNRIFRWIRLSDRVEARAGKTKNRK